MPPAASQPRPDVATPTPATRPTWPVTAAAVLLGWCYTAWVLFVAALNTAPFFGEQPTRDENIESGLALVAAVAPLALLVVLAVRWGSRWGILLLAGPSLLLAPLGLDWASRPGNGRDAVPHRSIGWSDLVTELVRPSWVVAAVLLVVLGASLVRSRRASRTAVDRPGR